MKPEAKKDIRALSRQEIRDFFTRRGEPAFRGNQVYEWLWNKGVHDFGEMTNLSKETREFLDEHFVINHIRVDDMQQSSDGTVKNAIRLHDGLVVESVFIPTKTRTTACVSSQVGCSLDCTFCATARLKKMRNLNPDEIYDQVVAIDQQSRAYKNHKLSNIVFMGMGEPLHNYDAVARALVLLTHPDGLDLSKRRVTVSTSGLVKQIDQLGRDFDGQVQLAISLHAVRDDARSAIMPVNRKHGLTELVAALRRYPLSKRQRITVEYTLIQGVNDSPRDAREMVELLRGIPVKVNLIPMNPISASTLAAPDQGHVLRFQEELTRRGLSVFVRKTRGDDVAAACGQLAFHGESRRSARA